MLTRSQVARRIGRSIATVWRMEGHSLHPEHGPQGTRMFDRDEVEEVAGRIARSGRALEGVEADCFEDRIYASHSSLDEPRSAQLLEALNEVSQLKRRLRRAKAEQKAWTSRVADAVDSVVAALGTSDGHLVDMLEELVGLLRRE